MWKTLTRKCPGIFSISRMRTLCFEMILGRNLPLSNKREALRYRSRGKLDVIDRRM
jgi:hypothetical protein